MSPSSERFLSLAEYLAESYFPHDAVQPLELAEKSGITSSFGDYEDAFDGLLELKRERFHIYLNENRLIDLAKPRARFTAAHELGHFFIDDHRQALIDGIRPHPSFTEFVTDNAAENQADSFAAALLMPSGRFHSEAKRIEVGLKSIRGLAALFGTSMMSTAIQYARSNVASVSVMLWVETERRWCWSSRDVWQITQNKAYKRTDRVPVGSATRELLDSPALKTASERGSVLHQWFPFVDVGSTKDRVCREEVMRLGEYGVLTLLEMC